MRRSNTTRLGDLLGDFIRNSPLEQPLKEVAVIEHWHEMMGEAMDKYIRHISVNKGVLYVEVSSSVVKSELFMSREELRRRLNERAGEILINKIVFR